MIGEKIEMQKHPGIGIITDMMKFDTRKRLIIS